MAAELTLTASLSYAKGVVAAVSRSVSSMTRDVTGSHYHMATQSIGTSAEALALSDVVNCGYLWVKNTDATNYVTIRMGAAGADVVKLNAGDIAIFRLAGNTPNAIANTAACIIEYILIEA